jgi:hypothetical protein
MITRQTLIRLGKVHLGRTRVNGTTVGLFAYRHLAWFKELIFPWYEHAYMSALYVYYSARSPVGSSSRKLKAVSSRQSSEAKR